MNASFKTEFEIPQRLDEATIQALTQQLRSTGCQEARDAIIESHIRLAMGVVSKFVGANRRRQDDIISAALHGLTQAVEWAPERLRDNNITPYIWATVQRFIRDFLAQDQVVTIERREFKRRLEANGLHETVPYLYKIEASDSDEENFVESEYKDVTPAVHDDTPGTELKELERHLHRQDETMVFIIDQLVAGYTMDEIGKSLGYSKQYISRLVAEIRGRVITWEKRNEQD